MDSPVSHPAAQLAQGKAGIKGNEGGLDREGEHVLVFRKGRNMVLRDHGLRKGNNPSRIEGYPF
jgi:hypothetical protein